MYGAGRVKGNVNQKRDKETQLNWKTLPICRLPHKNGASLEILLNTFKIKSI